MEEFKTKIWDANRRVQKDEEQKWDVFTMYMGF